MTIWGIAGGIYGLVLAIAALTQPIQRRPVALVASLAYTLVSVAAGTLIEDFWVNLLVPGALLLGGYWLSGFFFREPQPWLEAWLLRVDHAVGADQWMDRSARPVAEVLELSYAMVYLMVGGGAIYAAAFGTEAVTYYWNLVLASELTSYAPLPWLRSRPPRVLGVTPGSPKFEHVAALARPALAACADSRPGPADETTRAKPGPRAEGPLPAKPPATPSVVCRRLNTLILDHASVQANTLPSGHVSGAVAAALGVMAVDAVTGSWLIVAASLITIAAIAGRYHYVVDCISGAVVALIFWLLL